MPTNMPSFTETNSLLLVRTTFTLGMADQMQDKNAPKGKIAGIKNSLDDLPRTLTLKNLPALGTVAASYVMGNGLDVSFYQR